MDKLDIILSCIVTTISILITITLLSKEKLNINNIIKFCIIFIPLSIISCIYFEGVKRITVNISIIVISVYFSFLNKNISKSFYYSFVYEILAFIIELAICIVEIVVFKFDQDSYDKLPFAMLITSTINAIFVYILAKTNTISNIITKNYNSLTSKTTEWIYSIIMLILLIFLMAFNGYNLNNSLSFYINIGMTILTLLMLIYFTYSNIQKKILENNYNEMMDYVSKYEKIINEQGKKNHEYNNQLMVLKGYINKPDKLKEYLDIIIDDHKCGQNYMIKQLGALPDGGIKGLIYHKLSKMEDQNIKLYLYIDNNLKNIFEEQLDINTYKDVTKLLGVFLDNAIDATKENDKKEIEFNIEKEDKCIIISISNTYNEKTDLNQIGKRGYSTKGVGHGYGLSIVRDISKNNKNIETFSDTIGDKFVQNIILYYK